MAFTITQTTEDYTRRTNLFPNLVLKIQGIDTIFGAVTVKKFIKIGDTGLTIGGGWVIGGVNDVEAQKSYISLGGTTTVINQQLRQDEGAASSVSAVDIELIDKDGYVTNLISPGNVLEEIMGVKATLYFGFKETAWPDDYIPIFKGIIDDIVSGAGTVSMTLSHPIQKQRARMFNRVETKLNGSINDTDSTITVDSTSGIVTPVSSDILTNYIQIEDEIIRYTGITSTTFTGCARGQLGTTAVSHADYTEVQSRYLLEGNPIEIALKIMMSGGTDPYVSAIDVESFVDIGSTGSNANGIFFTNRMIQEDYNITAGDSITISGSTSNDGTYTVQSITVVVDGTYILVDSALTLETDSAGVASFSSRYNTLGEGLEMLPDDVDITEFEYLSTTYGSLFPDYSLFLKDSIENGKEFIEKEIFFPAALYSLPRKNRASVGFTNPPLSPSELKVFNSSNVMNPDKIKIRRSINRFFYNQVVYQFEEDYLEDKFKNGYIRQDADSVSRIPIKPSSLVISSKGLRNDPDTLLILDSNSRRFLDRYRYAAENIQGVKVLFRDAFNLEVGDVILFGDENLQISDVNTGTRAFIPRLFEIQNRRLDIKKGDMSLDLVDTNFLANARYGTISPSSVVGSGSTTSYIIVVEGGYGTASVSLEKEKWENYVGEKIIVHDESYSSTQEATFLGFDPGNSTKMLVSGLSTAPNSGDVVDIPAYPDSTDKTENAIYKALHAFMDPQVAVASGTSSTVFDVGSGDASKFFVDCVIRVHDASFSSDSGDVMVTAVSGTQITCQDLGFTPSSSYLVDLIGFPDEGDPYRLI